MKKWFVLFWILTLVGSQVVTAKVWDSRLIEMSRDLKDKEFKLYPEGPYCRGTVQSSHYIHPEWTEESKQAIFQGAAEFGGCDSLTLVDSMYIEELATRIHAWEYWHAWQNAQSCLKKGNLELFRKFYGLMQKARGYVGDSVIRNLTDCPVDIDTAGCIDYGQGCNFRKHVGNIFANSFDEITITGALASIRELEWENEIVSFSARMDDRQFILTAKLERKIQGLDLPEIRVDTVPLRAIQSSMYGGETFSVDYSDYPETDTTIQFILGKRINDEFEWYSINIAGPNAGSPDEYQYREILVEYSDCLKALEAKFPGLLSEIDTYIEKIDVIAY